MEVKRLTAEGPHWKQVQDRLAEQQKQIQDAQEGIQETRSELENNLSSTRDDLNGSIARAHDELVELGKRGERKYFEFDLTKSKQFQRVGSISLSLRKADTKHQRYEIAALLDDFTLSKKNVNLYEPVFLNPEGAQQPLQLVVNRIDKDQVHGYVSEPKYKSSESASNASQPADSPSGSPTTNSLNLPHRPESPQ